MRGMAYFDWSKGSVCLRDGRELGVIHEKDYYYPWITDSSTGTRFKALVGWHTLEGAQDAAERIAGMPGQEPPK